MVRTNLCTPDIRAGRLRKAGQFAEAAENVAAHKNRPCRVTRTRRAATEQPRCGNLS
jgi:hypothetical protein